MHVWLVCVRPLLQSEFFGVCRFVLIEGLQSALTAPVCLTTVEIKADTECLGGASQLLFGASSAFLKSRRL